MFICLVNNVAINLRSVDLNLLPVFDALMVEQNLTRAALRLHMSQPAVSSALKRLRIALADELFIRSAKGLSPTNRALQVHESVRQALGLIQTGIAQEHFDFQSSSRCFRICMNDALELLFAPQVARWQRQAAPNMSLQIHPDYSRDIANKLKQGELDFALDFVPYDSAQFIHRVVGHDALVVIAAQDHPQLDGKISRIQFESLPHVSIIPRSSRGTPMEQLLGHKKIKRHVAMHVSQFVSIPEIVASTDLIAVIPLQLANKVARQHKIKLLPLPFDYPRIEMSLIWHKSMLQDQAHLWFREQIGQLIKNF